MDDNKNELEWLFPDFDFSFDDIPFSDNADIFIMPNDQEIEEPEIPKYDYDNLPDITEYNIWYYYNTAETKEDRQKLLTNSQAIEYFQKYILEEASYEHYRRLFGIIDSNEIIHIFTESFIDEFTSKISRYDQYKLLAVMFDDTKDKNILLDKMLENEKLFEFFAKNHHYIYSNVIFDTEHYLKLIRKIEQDDLYSSFSMISIPKTQQQELMDQDHILKTLNWLLDKISLEEKSKFYSLDRRAPMTIPMLKRYADSYIVNGIKYGSHMLKHPGFFESLKCSSLLQFRKRINTLEDNCDNPLYVEEKVQEYYESMIKTYNPQTKMFSCYDEILEDEDKYYSSPNDGYLINSEIKWLNGTNKEKYIDLTNKKLSELIVDYLFQDTIFNVWHNIKSMLSYMEKLEVEEYPVPKEHLRFYELILKIDKIPPEEKIELFNKLKDKNIHISFYHDMRNTKDLAYKKIKDKMIDPTNPIFENQELTEKYKVPTMDLREEEFFMLVRTLNNFYHENSAMRAASSYTLISNENTATFSDDNIIYGYANFDIDKVEHMFDFDSFSSAFSGSMNNSQGVTNHVNQILTAEELANSGGYSEIILKNNEVGNKKYNEIKPDFVVVKNEPTPRDIKAAQHLNIPIVIIKEKRFVGSAHFILDESENYTNGNYNEEKFQANR